MTERVPIELAPEDRPDADELAEFRERNQGEKLADYLAARTVKLKQRFLEAYAGGMSRDEALQLIERTDKTLWQWRKRDKEFAARMDDVKARRYAQLRHGPQANMPDDAAGFSMFVQRYFQDRRAPQPQQLAIVDTLMKLKPRDVAMFLLWPEAGKTATIEDYICYYLARHPDHRFRIISQSQEHSKRIIDLIKRRMTDAGTWGGYIARWGPFYEKGQERHGRPWHSEEITIAKAKGDERDRSVVASSWSSATYGSRIDTLIIDDVCALENVNQSEQIVRRIQGTFLTRGKNMRTIIIGTRIAPDDVYQQLMDKGLLTRPPIIWPAATIDSEPRVVEFWDQEIYHDGNACCRGFRDDTCPRDGSKLTPREVMELVRHQVQEDAWWSHYMQQPVANPLSTFAAFLPPDSDLCLDKNRKVGELIGA